WLQSQSSPGERVLLLYPPGLEYIGALFGCFYAGVVAVPAYPPRRNKSSDRLTKLVSDSGATIALTTANHFSAVASLSGSGSQALRCIATETIADEAGEEWTESSVLAGELAFLQYTSGSTGDPRGVMLSHENLLHNSGLLARAFGYDSDS